jgi:hypothetical protein
MQQKHLFSFEHYSFKHFIDCGLILVKHRIAISFIKKSQLKYWCKRGRGEFHTDWFITTVVDCKVKLTAVLYNFCRFSLTKKGINLYQLCNYILSWNLHKPILYFSNITWWHFVDESISVFVYIVTS